MRRIAQSVWIVVLAIPAVYAQLRFPCSQLVTERLDPLVTPGEVSPHLHQIVGGNAFNITMDPENDLPGLSTCTTCRFVEDKSNYWTAVMYFKHPNGSFIRVPQMANHNTGPGIQDGGMTVYYFQPRAPTSNLNIVAFRKGFRMRVGNPMRRRNDIDPSSTEATATSFRCFVGSDPGVGLPGSGPADSFEFPSVPCSGGIRSNIYFPQCWNGVDLDSPDHESHVAHPIGALFGTDCPSTHPVRLPLLFMEIVWDTRPFNDPALWPQDGTQPFVFSMGDPTGYGQHADYVFGWEGDSLQRAMEVCFGGEGIATNCPVLTVQDTDSMNNCKQGAKVPEVTEGQYLEKLPGCNPLQGGPEPATSIPNCNAPSTTTAAPVPTGPSVVVIPPWTVCNPGTVHQVGVPFCDSIPPKTGTAGPLQTSPPAIVTPF
ncbi:hypothetical protein EST38_g7070 [Candolleomyces aberdarensis]|uniref:DUF1996 domain-containing protein n=1 Tax=Candolleomyces aberdarensis TaxID=2316362 RepID=A0A4Q2DIY5_9AGAR|nr:hypothetical protein EST38_g7070 [Candolleomyces aberdarensis]